MSLHSQSQTSSLGHHRQRPFAHDQHRKSTTPSYNAYSAFSSSPPSSSSPPRTPYSTRHAYGYTDIRSSPEIPADVAFRGVGEHIEDPFSSWGRYSARPHLKYSASAYTRAPYNSTYLADHDYPPQSDFDISELSEDLDHDVPDLDSEPASDYAPGQSSGVFSDSEEEEAQGDESDGFSFRCDGSRTTFFRTSAERGQWKTNPMPYRPAPSLLKSASTVSRAGTPNPTANPTRPISEPAPSTISVTKPDFLPSEKHLPERATEVTTCNSDDSIPIIPPTDEEVESQVESPHTLPSLSDDRDSSVDVDDHDMPSSPLPPSSPPMSPMHLSTEPISRSVSPISFAHDEFSIRGSSPLSEIPDDDEEPEDTGNLCLDSYVSDHKASPLSIASLLSPKLATKLSNPTLPDIPTPSHDVPIPVSGPSSSASEGLASCAMPDSEIASILAITTYDNATLSSPSEPLSIPDSVQEVTEVLNDASLAIECPAQDQTIEKVQSAALRDKNGVDRPLPETSTAASSKEKRKKDLDSQGVKKKKPKTATVSDAEASTSISKTAQSKKRTEEEENVDIDVVAEPAAAASKSRKRKRNDGDAAAPTTSTKRVAKSRRSKARASSAYQDSDAEMESEVFDAPLDPETAALYSQVCGMLIETMAMSRASSLPVSSLYKMVMQDQPSLKTQRTEKEWVKLFDQVLHRGEAGRGSGVFGKVESSGKDDADRPLEAQWFYVPELDEDQDRATLIRAMMPRPAKRSETKKYKQYYWRPLDKISKWDPEDEL